MRLNFFVALFSFSFLLVVASCQSGDNSKYQTLESGLTYKLHEEFPENEKPQVSDIVHITMLYTVNDSVIFNSSEMDREMRFPLLKPVFAGDFYEGIAFMHEGDSASFRCPAEQVFLEIFKVKTLPPFVKEGDMMRFDIRLIDFMTSAEYDAEQREKAMMEQQLSREKLQKYIDDEGITVEPTASGLYFVEQERGSGRLAKAGQLVKVHYTGRLTDGTVFDSSLERGQPIEFVLGEGKVISGWDEGIAMMRKGGKAMMVIPFDLAYGERAVGSIPAFSPLVFEVELIDISNK
ncbi:MAG: FKBP-type peptidyl-prolyl cis-trans isomerase [Bacteroidetes bacterium]|jgi:FKBP-type peptidyl-prolyl cis-trans isomerase FkpA|nr:FKBP-type peptidyl-prolyl cis-trans isomerase [Bacteroidota bacterium]